MIVMVLGKELIVSANFNSGDFLGTFSINKYVPDSYNSIDSDIKVQYNLSYPEFLILEGLICNTVEKYLRIKDDA